MLTQVYGSWPPRNFKQLDEAKKQEFFNMIKGECTAKKLKTVADNWLELTVSDFKGKESNTQYLPLGVWIAQGFDKDDVERSTDTKQDPVLGKLYGLEITTKYDGTEERQEECEMFSVTDGAGSAAIPVPGKVDKEKRKEMAEVIHIKKQNTENSTSRTKRIS